MDTDSLQDHGLSHDQAIMYSEIAERNRNRIDGWNVQLIRQFPNLTDFEKPVIAGYFAYTCAALKSKWIQKFHARNFGGGWTTPGDLARDYLNAKYPNRKPRCTTRQYQACVQHQRDAPLYARPMALASAIYLDLSAAYWQIVRACSWDVDYCPGAWLARGESMLDFPYPDEKMVRNCLVSVGLNGTMSMWTGREMITRKKPNKLINLVLWRLVQDVLNGIALDMIEYADAIYTYVDGYIIPEDREGIAFGIAETWGVDLHTKRRGSCDVRAPASYAFNEPTLNKKITSRYETMPYKLTPHSYAMNKVYDPDREFLRERFRRFALEAKNDWMFAQRKVYDPDREFLRERFRRFALEAKNDWMFVQNEVHVS